MVIPANSKDKTARIWYPLQSWFNIRHPLIVSHESEKQEYTGICWKENASVYFGSGSLRGSQVWFILEFDRQVNLSLTQPTYKRTVL